MSQTAKRGLGRGFEALLSNNFDKELILDEHERIQNLDLDVIIPNSDQPRRHFDQVALDELATSIHQHGVLLPLVVTVAQGGKYQIVAGERRWRAARIAQLEKVPVVIRSIKKLEQLEIALVENIQRVDLSPLEQATSLERLHQQFSVAYDSIAKRLGKAPSTINNMVRLLQLPDDAKRALEEEKIREGHARAILALKNNPDAQHQLLETIVANGWSVRQAERYVTSHKAGIHETQKVHERVNTETPVTKALSKRLGAPVQLRRTAKGGRLEIGFTSDDELEQIISRLS